MITNKDSEWIHLKAVPAITKVLEYLGDEEADWMQSKSRNHIWHSLKVLIELREKLSE